MNESKMAWNHQLNISQMVKKLEFPDIQLEEHPKEQVCVVVLHIMQTDQSFQKIHSDHDLTGNRFTNKTRVVSIAVKEAPASNKCCSKVKISILIVKTTI